MQSIYSPEKNKYFLWIPTVPFDVYNPDYMCEDTCTSSSSSSILLTDIYKGWSKSQHIITDTNIVHLTGYLKHVIDDAMAYQVYIQSEAGGNDTVNNQFERISPCSNCQGSRSSTDSCRIDNHRHPIIDLTVATTAPSSQCRSSTLLSCDDGGVSIITHIYPDVWAHDNNLFRLQRRVHHLQVTFQTFSHEDCCDLLKSSESNQESN